MLERTGDLAGAALVGAALGNGAVEAPLGVPDERGEMPSDLAGLALETAISEGGD